MSTRGDRKRAGGPGRKSAAPRSGGLRGAFQQHQDTAVDSLLRLLGEPLASLLTAVVIGIALALPLCLLLLLQNLQQLGAGIEQSGRISVYLSQQATPARQQELLTRIGERTDIAAVELISPEQALAEFESGSGFGDVLQGLDENPLPALLLVTPAALNEAQVTALRDELQQLDGVELAQADLEWLQRLNALLDFAMRLALLLALLLGLGVVLAIGNTTRMAIENRRDEIVVVKLVGGTDAFVSRPFLYTGFWYGCTGGLIALLIVFLSLLALRGPVLNLLGAYGSNFEISGLGISGTFLVLFSAAALGWVGAWLSVLRHLRAIEPR